MLLLLFTFFGPSINNPIVSLLGFFCFKVFSPSKLPVSIKHIPSGKGESNNTKSAGKISSCSTITISPNSKLPLSISIHSSFLYTLHFTEFCNLSKLALLQSSYASLIKLTDKTNIIGNNAVAEPKGDITGIH